MAVPLMAVMAAIQMASQAEQNQKGAMQNAITNYTNVRRGGQAKGFEPLYNPAQTGINAYMGYQADKQSNDRLKNIYDLLNAKNLKETNLINQDDEIMKALPSSQYDLINSYGQKA